MALAGMAAAGAAKAQERAPLPREIAGLEFTDAEREEALKTLGEEFLPGYESIRKLALPNSVAPPTPFVPVGRQPEPGKKTEVRTHRANLKRPKDPEDLAFLTLAEVSHLLRSSQVSPVELTELALERLQTHGPKLRCLVTPTRERALVQARQAEKELAAGKRRGPLHGVPYGIKDLFASKGYPTTFGAEPYMDQVIDEDAAVIERLDEAGAVLVGKLSLGALAMNDHWFRGRTRNPWKPDEGSSGSSAGSACAMAAGLVPFTIGTETLGSIVSPSQRCRVTGLRPTFGRVSRYGAMALSWSMDKVGPICRTAEDAALVLAAIHGKDPRDAASVDRPFRFRPLNDLSGLKIAVLGDAKPLEEGEDPTGITAALDAVRKLGGSPSSKSFTPADFAILVLLSVEAAAAFDDITRDGRVNTIPESGWPAIFRSHRLVPGVEYLQAMRARSLAMETFERELEDFDVVLAPDRAGYLLFNTNLTGHPQVYVPLGVNEKGQPMGVSVIGRLYDEGTALAVADAIQRQFDFHRLRPDPSAWLGESE